MTREFLSAFHAENAADQSAALQPTITFPHLFIVTNQNCFPSIHLTKQ
jgi:hypothetical protein